MRTIALNWVLHTAKWQYIALELLVALALVGIITTPAQAAMRLQDRSLYMNSSAASAETFYRISFRYMSPDPVGSVDLLFCNDPIPYHPCVVPSGLDVSSADLTEQLGETGFAVTTQTQNRIVLSRIASAPVDNKSSYTLDGIINPTDPNYALSIRIKTHTSTDASGPQVDFGSIRGQITDGVVIETQVPPMLIFCLAEEVEYNCDSTNEVHYKDMGELSPTSTLTAQSQMAVGTNATGGFAITAVGTPLSAGTNTIPSPSSPAVSRQGVNQFGINLVANTEPTIGGDPEGEWMNAVVTPGYATPNRYKFTTGDVVAYSTNVSLMKKFTVSYVVNSSADLKPGVYTSSINFIASGRF